MNISGRDSVNSPIPSIQVKNEIKSETDPLYPVRFVKKCRKDEAEVVPKKIHPKDIPVRFLRCLFIDDDIFDSCLLQLRTNYGTQIHFSVAGENQRTRKPNNVYRKHKRKRSWKRNSSRLNNSRGATQRKKNASGSFIREDFARKEVLDSFYPLNVERSGRFGGSKREKQPNASQRHKPSWNSGNIWSGGGEQYRTSHSRSLEKILLNAAELTREKREYTSFKIEKTSPTDKNFSQLITESFLPTTLVGRLEENGKARLHLENVTFLPHHSSPSKGRSTKKGSISGFHPRLRKDREARGWSASEKSHRKATTVQDKNEELPVHKRTSVQYSSLVGPSFVNSSSRVHALAGQTARLNCEIKNLHNYTVSAHLFQ